MQKMHIPNSDKPVAFIKFSTTAITSLALPLHHIIA